MKKLLKLLKAILILFDAIGLLISFYLGLAIFVVSLLLNIFFFIDCFDGEGILYEYSDLKDAELIAVVIRTGTNHLTFALLMIGGLLMMRFFGEKIEKLPSD